MGDLKLARTSKLEIGDKVGLTTNIELLKHWLDPVPDERARGKQYEIIDILNLRGVNTTFYRLDDRDALDYPREVLLALTPKSETEEKKPRAKREKKDDEDTFELVD